MIKDYLKKKLKQFLCEHNTTDIDKKIATTLWERQWKYHDDGSREPADPIEKTLHMKVWHTCGKCGAKLTLEYHD